jgi:hypothetical protein
MWRKNNLNDIGCNLNKLSYYSILINFQDSYALNNNLFLFLNNTNLIDKVFHHCVILNL